MQQQENVLSVNILNPTPGVLSKLAELLRLDGASKKRSRKSEPEETVSDDEDESFGKKPLKAKDLDEDEDGEDADTDESDDEGEEEDEKPATAGRLPQAPSSDGGLWVAQERLWQNEHQSAEQAVALIERDQRISALRAESDWLASQLDEERQRRQALEPGPKVREFLEALQV